MRVMRRTVTRRNAGPHFQRRASLRHDVSVRGAVIVKVGDATRTAGCLILDLSLGGAKVELDEDGPLPDKVLLYESHRENVYECSIRWRDGRSVGLSFLDQIALSERRALISEVSHGVVESMRDLLNDNEPQT